MIKILIGLFIYIVNFSVFAKKYVCSDIKNEDFNLSYSYRNEELNSILERKDNNTFFHSSVGFSLSINNDIIKTKDLSLFLSENGNRYLAELLLPNQ